MDSYSVAFEDEEALKDDSDIGGDYPDLDPPASTHRPCCQRNSKTPGDVSFEASRHLDELRQLAQDVAKHCRDNAVSGSSLWRAAILNMAVSRCIYVSEDEAVCLTDDATCEKWTPQRPRNGISGVGSRLVYPKGSVGFKTSRQLLKEACTRSACDPAAKLPWTYHRALDMGNLQYYAPSFSKLSWVVDC
jgi:hypothetical protein